jgi:hypothetical protein
VELAGAESLPFPARVPEEQAREIADCWNDLFGGWQPSG